MRRTLLLVLLSLALPVTADVGKFDPEGRERSPLKAYPVIVVEPLADAVEERPEGDKATAFGGEVEAGGERFAAELVAKASSDPKRQREFARSAPAEGDCAVVGGRIVDFHDGNIAQRYIGIGGRDRFAAVVEVKDGRTGALLGTVKINLKGSFIPGGGLGAVRAFNPGAPSVRGRPACAPGPARRWAGRGRGAPCS